MKSRVRLSFRSLITIKKTTEPGTQLNEEIITDLVLGTRGSFRFLGKRDKELLTGRYVKMQQPLIEKKKLNS